MASAVRMNPRRRYLLLSVVLALTLYVVLPQISAFHDSWHLLKRPDWRLVGWAVSTTLTTYFFAAGTYCWLALRRLPYWRTLVVEYAAMFINRLLPGGVGALGTNFVYLRREGHSAVQAAAVVAINNALGLIGHSLVVAFCVLLASGVVQPRGASLIKLPGWLSLVLTGAGLSLLLVVLSHPGWRKKLQSVSRQLVGYRHQPWRLVGGLSTSIGLTLSNIICLGLCAAALHVSLSPASLVLIFSLGIGLGTATPTPGGLGGFEAGLVAGLVAYSVPSPTALAIALLYRLLSYWLPLVLGALALITTQKRGYL